MRVLGRKKPHAFFGNALPKSNARAHLKQKLTKWPNLLTMLTQVVLMNCLFLFFIHLKLELLTQFPATNDEKNMTINVYI